MGNCAIAYQIINILSKSIKLQTVGWDLEEQHRFSEISSAIEISTQQGIVGDLGKNNDKQR